MVFKKAVLLTTREMIITVSLALFLTACVNIGDVEKGTTTVSGSVLDVNRYPVASALVTISSLPVTVITDKNGKFSAVVEVGDHEMVIKRGSLVIYTGTFTCKGIPMSLGEIHTSYNPVNLKNFQRDNI